MRVSRGTNAPSKGWHLGPWNAHLPIALGYANTGIDEPHLHLRTTEIYLVARGRAEVRIEQETTTLDAGDVLVLQPGEAHTFLATTPEYHHFVLHVPALAEEEARADKVAVARGRLGLM